MSNENKLITHNYPVVTLEEFRKSFFELNQDDETTLLDKASDLYEKVPAVIKIAKNLDPTGLLSSIDDVLTENRNIREQNRIVDALYYLYRYNLNFTTAIEAALLKHREEFLSITEIYLQRCKETYDEKKVKYYASIWFESVLSNEPSLDEKEYVFALVSSLTTDQIKVLKFIYDRVKSDFDSTLKENGKAEKRPFGIKGFAESNKLDYPYVQQICIDLQGKGLLLPGAGSFLSSSPHSFSISDYVETLIKYLEEAIE